MSRQKEKFVQHRYLFEIRTSFIPQSASPFLFYSTVLGVHSFTGINAYGSRTECRDTQTPRIRSPQVSFYKILFRLVVRTFLFAFFKSDDDVNKPEQQTADV